MSDVPALPQVTGTSSSRNLKRRFSSSGDLAFFTPASTSFNPKPYVSSVASSHVFNVPKMPPPVRSHPPASIAQPIPVMDPSPSDPNVVFIHPPFVDFPNSHLYPEGLSYSLMAANLEWFLDQNDFISPVSTNPNAIPYPPQLEPPRGWCPAKKKSLKALGPDGWPEGEEPRLRCTFCRRTYAGVNAKSMWRRHVYEKHKIAMSNRRDNNDRARGGRGAHKEQRQGTSDKENLSDGPRHGTKSSDVGATKLKARPFLASPEVSPGNLMADPETQTEIIPTPSAPLIEQTEFPPTVALTCHADELLKDEAAVKQVADKCRLLSEGEHMSLSPKRALISIPLSPYDPTLTPSFRHSPPRLPSDQPWRFPSPSHPLHSKAREICLSMLVRGGVSPIIKGDIAASSSSPSMAAPSVINTPCSVVGRSRTFGDLGSTFVNGSSPIIFRPSPRQLFSDGQSPVAGFNRLEYCKNLNDSPLGIAPRHRLHLRKKSAMSFSLGTRGDWLSEASLSSTSSVGVGSSPVQSISHEDPFGGIYRPLLEPRTTDSGTNQKSPSPPPPSSPKAESPVVRNARLTDISAPELEAGLVGLGIGLMAPFTLSTSRTPSDHSMDEDADELEVEKSLAGSVSQVVSVTITGDDSQESPPLKKRRKTKDRRVVTTQPPGPVF